MARRGEHLPPTHLATPVTTPVDNNLITQVIGGSQSTVSSTSRPTTTTAVVQVGLVGSAKVTPSLLALVAAVLGAAQTLALEELAAPAAPLEIADRQEILAATETTRTAAAVLVVVLLVDTSTASEMSA